jgi:hypothetical protein
MKNTNWIKIVTFFLLLTTFILILLLYSTDKSYCELELKAQNKVDSLEILSDSLREEIFDKSNEIAMNELIINELSQTKRYRELEIDFEKEKNLKAFE